MFRLFTGASSLVLMAALLPSAASALEFGVDLPASELTAPPEVVSFLLFDSEEAENPFTVYEYESDQYQLEYEPARVRINASPSEELELHRLWVEAEVDGKPVSERTALTASGTADFRIAGDNGVLFQGTIDSGTIPATGEGTRFMWYPGKAALRAGTVTSTQWDDSNIGNYSTAMGFTTTASGYSSMAMGSGTTASHDLSTAMGSGTTASGYSSTAMGRDTTASGNYSTAMGDHTSAKSRNETVIGSFNTDYDPVSANGWFGTDRLFVIGNGNGHGYRSDAMVMLKNGNVGIGISKPTAKLHLVSEDDIAPLQLVPAGTSEHMRLVPRSSLPTGATEGDIYANASGTIYYRSNSTWTAMNSAADFSELIIPVDSSIEAHDGAGRYEGEIGFSEIISINDNGHYASCKRPYDERISGIESGNRGIYYLAQGSPERRQGQRQFGAIGHVKLKVSAENGLIKPGDFITCSGSQPGIGMKATKPGRVVGIAKEAFDGTPGQIGLIEVFVDPHTWLKESTPALAAMNKEVTALKQEVLSLREELQQYRQLTLEVAELKRQISRSLDLSVARNR